MSSLYVRNEFFNFVDTALPTENVIDISGEFDNINDFTDANGLNPDDPWLGIQYIGAFEEPVDIVGNNLKGTYREAGSIYIHVVGVAGIGQTNAILTRAEAIRDAIRGQRINDMVIETVAPPTVGGGATLSFTGGLMSATILIEYHRDLNL